MRQTVIKQTIAVDWCDRWQVFHRLQELGINCWCEANQPLMVEVESAIAAIQVWSVIRQVTSSRQQLIWALERCWHRNL
ncbi:Asr1405/Asl0597 family protein [Calothrix sp. UHCC 0171]|uniref:Asr1405/Asl0597 family protein n=1 Tax=Calothrix sp. UHCC 0171 TaxID=3110245 RepID=UPI002B21C371|nr:Asr1405/Asl0597 family protein [Calothrix sp. UHCC 0171]MEA5569934.1 hypothetical protein [Calothrix sp. UHCC 0171]